MMDLATTSGVGVFLAKGCLESATHKWKLPLGFGPKANGSSILYLPKDMLLDYFSVKACQIPYERAFCLGGESNEVFFGYVLGIFYVTEFDPWFISIF